MNQTSATGNAAGPMGDTTAFLTNVHLVWLLVLAVVVVIGILYGARLKRQRTIAERQAVIHAREAGVVPATDDQAEQDDEGVSTPAPAPSTRTVEPVPPGSVAAIAQPGDDAASGPLSQLKGLGPKVAARLAELGITTVGQVAALDHDAAQALDAQLGTFRGRMERDRWVEQARFLAAGDRAGFEAVFGKL